MSAPLHEYAHHHGDVAKAHWTRVHNSNVVPAVLAKASMSTEYSCEPLARCHEAHFAVGSAAASAAATAVCGAVDIVFGEAVVDWLSSPLSSLSLSLSASCNAAVCAPTQ